ncbi:MULTISPECIES: hypothetical protein [Thermus]|nr:hypothetical protein [Thermus scotoductus]
MQTVMEALYLEDVLEEMTRDLKATVGAPEGVRTYALWGVDPFELETALYDMLKHLGREERDVLRWYIPDLVETVYREGYNVLILLPTGEGLHAKGGSVPLAGVPGNRVFA